MGGICLRFGRRKKGRSVFLAPAAVEAQLQPGGPLGISCLDAGGSIDHHWWFPAVPEAPDILEGRGGPEKSLSLSRPC